MPDINYFQVDNKVEKIIKEKGLIVMESKKAWEMFKWCRKYFDKKPKEGYFAWIKRQPACPIFTCVTIATKNVSQDLRNLVVIEPNLKVNVLGVCSAKKRRLQGTHKAIGKMILKEGVTVNYNHLHKWGEKDNVVPSYTFFMEKNSSLIYNYKNLFPPKNLKIETHIVMKENASANLKIVTNARNSNVNITDNVELLGENSNAIVRLRIVGRENSKVNAVSRILAKGAGKGHLDCQGLLISKNASIKLTPELIDENKKAILTHEASIGKVADEQINYLRTRGLSEKEAIDMIVNGFLGK